MEASVKTPFSDFWHMLEKWIIPEPEKAVEEWRSIVKDSMDFDAFLEVFLEKTGKTVREMRCPVQCGEKNCRRRLEAHGDAYHSICPNKKCGTFTLDEESVCSAVFLEEKFHRLLAEALPIEPHTSRGINPQTWLLGTLRNHWEACWRVYMTYVPENRFVDEILRLIVSDNVPVVVLTLSDTPLRQEEFLLLRASKAIRLPIRKLVSVDPFGRFFPAMETEAFFRNLLSDSHEAQAFGISQVVFPCDLEWHEVFLQFIDGHTLLCKARNTRCRLSYYDFGMVDDRNNTPDAIWKFMIVFSKNNGVLPVKRGDIALNNQLYQKKHRMCKHLQKVFHIASPPVEYLPLGIYRCRFSIKPDTDIGRAS